MLAARETAGFAYGPGSFHRHLAAVSGGPVRVVVATATALDLDTPDDLAAAAGSASSEQARSRGSRRGMERPPDRRRG